MNRYSVSHKGQRSDWPLWIILAVVGIGVVVYLMWPQSPESAGFPEPVKVVQPAADAGERLLKDGARYVLLVEMPMLAEPTFDAQVPEGASVKRLSPQTHIVIGSCRWRGEHWCYRVRVVEPDGATVIDKGWISGSVLGAANVRPADTSGGAPGD
jgi:hypothetical protein